jgi:hypothetical protein
MTRTDVMASSRPRTVSAAPMRRGSSSFPRGLSLLAAALLSVLALTVPSTAAAESTAGYGTTTTTTTTAPSTSGYGQTPTTPTTTPTTTTPSTTPSTGTLPSKESEKPATTPTSETAPAKTSSTPTTATSPKASTLPFTGFDLRWDIGFGLLLMGAGFSIVAMQRRQRRQSGR